MISAAPASNSMSVQKLAALHLGAVVFSETRQYFKARDLAEFFQMGGKSVDDERANEILLELCQQGLMREIGPATYAKPASMGDRDGK